MFISACTCATSNDDLKTGLGEFQGVQLQMPPESPSEFTKNENAPANRRKAGPGRPPGLPNRITREMHEAIIAAAEELGGIDFDKWKDHLQGDTENRLRRHCRICGRG